MTLINPEIEELVQKQYTEMKKAGKTEEVVNNPVLGNLTLFIGRMPKIFICKFAFDADVVYVGSDE